MRPLKIPMIISNNMGDNSSEIQTVKSCGLNCLKLLIPCYHKNKPIGEIRIKLRLVLDQISILNQSTMPLLKTLANGGPKSRQTTTKGSASSRKTGKSGLIKSSKMSTLSPTIKTSLTRWLPCKQSLLKKPLPLKTTVVVKVGQLVVVKVGQLMVVKVGQLMVQRQTVTPQLLVADQPMPVGLFSSQAIITLTMTEKRVISATSTWLYLNVCVKALSNCRSSQLTMRILNSPWNNSLWKKWE